MKNLFILSLVLVFLPFGSSAQTSLQGKVADKGSKEPILFCNVALFQDGKLLTGVESDFDGNYMFSNIDPGIYDIEVTYVGYKTERIIGLEIKEGKNELPNILIMEGQVCEHFIGCRFFPPMIRFDEFTQGRIFTAEDIKHMPVK